MHGLSAAVSLAQIVVEAGIEFLGLEPAVGRVHDAAVQPTSIEDLLDQQRRSGEREPDAEELIDYPNRQAD